MFAAVFFVNIAMADTLSMQEGLDIEGVILDETGEHIVIQTEGVTLAIERSKILEIKRGPIQKAQENATNDVSADMTPGMKAKQMMGQAQHKSKSWLSQKQKDLKGIWAKTKLKWKKLKKQANEKGWFKPAGKSQLDKTQMRKTPEKKATPAGEMPEKFKTIGDVRKSVQENNAKYDEATK
jgi:hypothetical protein